MSAFGEAWWNSFAGAFVAVAPPVLTPPFLALILGGAFAATVPRPAWRYSGLFVTVVHELGHAFAALSTLQRVSGIRLRFDQSGTTTSWGRAGWKTVWTGFWGYPAPAVVGVLLVWAAGSGWSAAALSVGSVVLLLLVLLIRNAQGFLIAGAAAAAASLLVAYAPPPVVAGVTLSGGLGLLVGSLRDWMNVVRLHRRGGRGRLGSDAHLLQERTGIPSAVWLFLFAVVIAGAGIGSAYLLAGSVVLGVR